MNIKKTAKFIKARKNYINAPQTKKVAKTLNNDMMRQYDNKITFES